MLSRMPLRSLATPRVQVSAAASTCLAYVRCGSVANISPVFFGGSTHPLYNPRIRQVWPGPQGQPDQHRGMPSVTRDKDNIRGAASVEPMHAMAIAEHAELRRQVQRLSAQCASLSAQVDKLVTVLQVGPEPAGATGFARIDNQEQLLREIMRADGISRKEALEIMHRMCSHNNSWNRLYSAPYYVGIAVALFASVVSTALVFHPTVVELYASKVAGEDLPEGVEHVNAMTLNQVGAWSWTWVEPMIGMASFVLLCMQFARAQAGRVNLRCYKQLISGWRVHGTIRAFSRYNENVVGAWAKQLPLVKWSLPALSDNKLAATMCKQRRMCATNMT